MRLFKVRVKSVEVRYRDDVIAAETEEDARKWLETKAHEDPDYWNCGDWSTSKYEPDVYVAENIKEVTAPSDVDEEWLCARPWGDPAYSHQTVAEILRET